MQKSALQAQLMAGGLTEDLLQTVQEELAAYPEELTVEHLKQFDQFLADLQMGEMDEAHQLERLADSLEEAGKGLDSSFEEFTFKSLRAMKSGLSQAQDATNIAGEQVL
jgi:CheY-like chemotaxis protein